jgi:phosphoribosylaminoimidazolecarboxamide formyltransferase/IMP cyclohydrolase
MRAAAKTHAHAAVVSDPADYAWMKEELKGADGSLSPSSRRKLAQKAFARASQYDQAISRCLSEHS